MKLDASAAAQAAATLPLFPTVPRPDTDSSLFQAAASLTQALGRGQALDAHTLARGDGDGVRRFGRRRRLGLEARLRCLRGGAGALPAPIRSRHARPRRIAGSVPRHARQARGAGFRRRRAARRNPRRFSNSRRRSRSASPPLRPPRSHRPISCWSLRRAPACSPSSPSLPERGSF